MITQHIFSYLRKSIMVWFGVLAGILMLSGCGGSSGGGATNIPAGNQSPEASISSPTGTYFKEGENITFTGSATDAEDGQLNGNALVWTSSIDGPLGTGETLITSALSAGEHDITLTATDSEGEIATATLPTISVAQTRFIKMGFLTTGVPDVSNAFDGDMDTAATIQTPNTELIQFKAYIGTENKFIFKIKLGAVSMTGSKLSIEGLDADNSWQIVSEIFLYAEKTVTVKIENAQDFAGPDGYINLSARAVNIQEPDNVTIYEIWRIDPPDADSATQEVTNPDAAFDENKLSFAVISTPWNLLNPQGIRNFLYFKVYVGVGMGDTFTFKILTNNIGSYDYLAIDVEDRTTPEADDWKTVESLSLDTVEARSITIADAQNYLDEKGYISLRASRVTTAVTPSDEDLNIYEIWRYDPFFVGPKSTTDPQWDYQEENAVDGDDNTFAGLYYFWNEYGHFEFFHFQAYAGDASNYKFSIRSGISAPGSNSELIVEGEREPDKWSLIERIALDDIKTTIIDLQNARQYVNADGRLSIRLRWESDSDQHDAYIYEIRHETD